MSFASDQGRSLDGLSATSIALLALREAVFERWVASVRMHVDGADALERPVLIDTLPVLYDNLAEALTLENPRLLATSNTDVAVAHGSERARTTSYGPEQVIHEYQLFRDAIVHVARLHALAFNTAELDTIDRSINQAVRESVREFSCRQEDLRHRMAAALSHDMRTPLAVIVNGAQLIGTVPHLASAQTVATKILSHGMRLGVMVNDLIDALTFDRGPTLPLALSRFDLLVMVRDTCDGLRSSVAAELDVTGEAVDGYWCRSSMMRALENLINNAVKYGDGTVVTVKVSQFMGRAMLSVHNLGNAIPLAQRERIFAYLRRGAVSPQGGWGIGLPFVQSVAESHGGCITVDSSPVNGTTFLVDIPIDCRSAEQ